MAGRERAVRPAVLAGGVAVVALVMALAPFLRGALVVAKHEGDTLHLADVVLRMADFGQLPHLDFMTPIGIGAVWPIAIFAKAGLGLGHAFFAAQTLVAALLFLPAIRAAASRLPGLLAWGLALYVMVLCLAMVHGEANAAASVSMHYNRWAWALAYIAVPLALFEPLGRRRPVLDGAIIGLMLAGMAMIKVTYFVAFLPPIAIALIARRDLRTLGVALATGLAVAGGLTLGLGFEFWLAYLHDLATVAGSETRAAPGVDLGGVMALPAYLLGTLVLLATVILLRQAGRMTEGMVLLFLVPSFVYVTYQNYGNDPQWLVLLGLIALALRPEGAISNGFGWRLGPALTLAGVMALTLGAASVTNLLWSPFRMALAQPEGLVPLLAKRPQDADLLVESDRVYRVGMMTLGHFPGGPYAAFDARAKLRPQSVLRGETLADCEITTGVAAWFEAAAQDLTAAGYGGRAILVADLFSAIWLFGDFKPVEGAAPWYYGGLAGLDAAEYVLVPLCSTGLEARDGTVKALDESDLTLTEVRRTPTYILLRPERG
ncbi:MAG: hypothetical protein IE922_05720 [Sphingomonadales bacterium]|nr:hypothetical protein [Sphingomonadales bacterium]